MKESRATALNCARSKSSRERTRGPGPWVSPRSFFFESHLAKIGPPPSVTRGHCAPDFSLLSSNYSRDRGGLLWPRLRNVTEAVFKPLQRDCASRASSAAPAAILSRRREISRRLGPGSCCSSDEEVRTYFILSFFSLECSLK